MRRTVAAVAVAVVLLLAASCGSDPPAVSADASGTLLARTSEIRDLAAAGRPEEALARATELEGLVADLRARGEVTAEGADEILDRAAAVVAELQLVTTTTTTTAPPPPVTEGDDEQDEDRGNGNGNGRDRERDDD